MRTAFEYEGEIRSIDLLACLVTSWRENASGSLQFSRSGATAGFEIVGGEIAASSSSDPRFETAAILVRAGKLDTRTLERLAAPEGADRALLALQAGVLTRREHRWGEKIRAVEILSDLLGWLDGEYYFFRGAESVSESAEPRLPIPRLVLELFLRSRDRSLVLKYLGGADVPLARAPNFDAEFATFGLTADAESVVRMIDGTSSAEEIASEAPAEAFAIEKLLAALVTLGLVHPAFAGAGTGGSASEPSAGDREDEAAPEPEREAETDEEAEEEPVVEESADARAQATPTWDVAQPEETPEAEPVAEGPSELGDEIEEGPPGEAEERVDAPLAGGHIAPDLEFASLGDEPGRTEPGSVGRPDREPPPAAPALDRSLDAAGEIETVEPTRPRSKSPLVWILLLLAAAVGGIAWWRSRGAAGAPPSEVMAVAPTRTEEVPSGAAAGATATPEAPPIPVTAVPTSAPASAVVPGTPGGRARPTPRPTKGRPSLPAPTAAAAPAQAAEGKESRQYWVDRAARDAQRLAADRKTRYAIQLELACETTSLVDAFQHDRGASMWLLATTYQGRSCFRVLWGRYPTPEAARRGLSGSPRFFSTARNHPAVTSVR